MKAVCFTFLLLCFAHLTSAQVSPFQPGHRNHIWGVKFCPDDRHLLSYTEGNLYLWDVASGRVLWQAETWFIRKLRESFDLQEFAWSQDEQFLVTKSANGTYQTWDANTGQILAVTEQAPTLALRPMQTLRQTSAQGELSHDGNLQAFPVEATHGDDDNAAIKLRDQQTGAVRWLRAHPGTVRSIAYRRDGRYFAVAGSDTNIYVFAAQTRMLVQTLVGHTSPYLSVAFSGDGQRLLSWAKDGAIKTWDWPAGKLLQSIKIAEKDADWRTISFSADGQYALTSGETTRFRLWDAQQGILLRAFEIKKPYAYTSGDMTIGYSSLPVLSATFNPSGNRILSGHPDNTLRFWNLAGKQRGGISIRRGAVQLQLSPDERTVLVLATKGLGRELRLYDARLNKELMHFDDKEAEFIKAIVFSPDGQHFATSDSIGNVCLWAINQSKPLYRLGDWRQQVIAFSPDGKTLAAGGENQNLALYDVRTGKQHWQLLPSYQPNKLEARLTAERAQREAQLRAQETAAQAQRNRQAARDLKRFKNQVSITFEHYGDMTNPLDERILSSGEPGKSQVKKAPAEANAVWLRLHNDAPLPLEVTTFSASYGKSHCYHEFAPGVRAAGLCNNREISLQFEVQDRHGKPVPSGICIIERALILPQTAVWFAVPRSLWQTGYRVRFAVTFQKETAENKVADYGKPLTLEVPMKD
ncbi:MAG: hypothetical protein JST84_03955 [Acidobacteria bacterium]|nr:hypothetical protein [Acidobacteriota bacterium]